MSTATASLTLTALFAFLASGQTIDRVFQFTHTSVAQNMQGITSSIRVIGDIQDVQVDTAAGTMTVHGTTDQAKLAEWLFLGMDRPVPIAADGIVHEYRMAEGTDNVVRLFYMDRGQTVQEFQELATLMRTIGEVRRMYTYNAGRTLVGRGTADQMDMLDFLAGEMGQSKPAPRPHSVSRQYLLPADPAPRPNENVTRIFYAANTPTIQDFQELATLLRTIVDIRRVFTFNTPRAIAVRGTGDQIQVAQELFNELDQPAHASLQASFAFQDPFDEEHSTSIRVFYLPHTQSAQDFQKIATSIRTTTGTRRAFTYNLPRALALRGTPDQIKQATLMLPDLDPADFPKAP